MPLTEAAAGAVAAGISAAGSIAAQGVGNVKSQHKWKQRQDYLNKQQIAAEQRQFDYNKQLADYSYDLNRQQWNAENSYNSPGAQMQRYRAAGLNPNLIYGDSGAMMASAASPQMSVDGVSTSTPNAPYSDMPSAASAFPEAVGLGLQQMVTKAQVANLNAKTLETLSDADFKNASFDLRLDELVSGIEKTISETSNIQTDTEGKQIANEVDFELKDTKIAQAKENLENTKKQGYNLDKMNGLLQSQIDKTNLEGDLIKVQKKIADLDAKIKKVDADNADVLMDLRKQRENAALRLANNQIAMLGHQLKFIDAKSRAEIALSAAETLNRKAFAGLADSRKDYQDYVNRMNDILLNPDVDVDAKTYFSAIILKNMSETSFLDVMKYVSSELHNTGDSSSGSSVSSEDAFKILRETTSKMSPQQKQILNSWFDKHQNASALERLEIAKQILGE